jgi:hypothetical protein
VDTNNVLDKIVERLEIKLNMLFEDDIYLENRFNFGHIVGPFNRKADTEKAPSAQTLHSSIAFLNAKYNTLGHRKLRLTSTQQFSITTTKPDNRNAHDNKH